MQRTEFGTGFEFRSEGEFKIVTNNAQLVTVNGHMVMTSNTISPVNAGYVVLAPAGPTFTHDTNVPITFNQTTGTIPTQWTLQAAGAGFNISTPGLYRFDWGINNAGADSQFYIQHSVNAAQVNSEQWVTGTPLLAGVQNSHNYGYFLQKTTTTTDSHTFLIRGATHGGADPTIGAMGLSITQFPNSHTFP